MTDAERSVTVASDDNIIVAGQRELTPTQVTSMLRHSGVLNLPEVARVHAEPFGVGESMMSEITRLRIEYAEPVPANVPSSVIVKHACRDPRRRGIANRGGFYAREVAFYEHLAANVAIRSPRCHAAAIDATTGEFTLVLEDLEGMRSVMQIDGGGWSEAVLAVDSLAALHGPWWGRTDRLPVQAAAFDGDDQVANFVATFTESWPTCRRLAADILPAALVAIGDRWHEVGPALASRLAGPGTLCHGDFRLDNMRFDDAGIVAFDWQLLIVAHGVTDLAYFGSQSLRTEVRAGRDRELVERYVAELGNLGVNVDPHDAWDVYRHSVLAMVVFPVTLIGGFESLDPLGKRTAMAMLERSVAAITELDACAVQAMR